MPFVPFLKFNQYVLIISMARRNRDGRYIISAGEVGVYTVCPEAWRLQYVLKKRVSDSEDVKKGRELHANWANEYAEATELVKLVRKIILLVVFTMFLTAILVYVERKDTPTVSEQKKKIEVNK